MSSPEAKVAAERIRFARAYAAQQLPWFAPALYRCRIIVSDRVDVASVDVNYNVYWNPEVVDHIWSGQEEAAALRELGFLWVHEISHLLRRHAARRKSLLSRRPVSPRAWNVAADFEINDNNWPGLTMPNAYPGMLPERFGFPSDLLAERYLDLVEQSGTKINFPLDEGSGVHGTSRDWEDGEGQELSELTEELTRRRVAEAMREAGHNKIPTGWRHWSEQVLTRKTDWRRSLGHRLSIAIQNGIGSRMDYSFARPGRRQSVYHPAITPSLRGDRTARIAIVVDTSGSMNEEDLARSLAEVADVIRTFNYPVTLIPCDEKSYAPVSVLAAREAFRLQQLPGGGGTDLRAGISTAESLQPRPDAILVLTDGFSPYPDHRAAVKVVFGIFADAENERTRPLPPMPPFNRNDVVFIRP